MKDSMGSALDTPPSVPTPTPFTPETPQVFTLENGIDVWLLPRPALPLISIRIIFAGGAASDPPHQFGLTTLTDEMMLHGAGQRDATAFADVTERHAIDIGMVTAASSTVLYADTHRQHLPLTLSLLSDVVHRPLFTVDDLNRVRALQMADILQELDTPAALAPWVSAKLYFGEDHPYAHPEAGIPSGLSAITPDDLRASWKKRFTTSRAHIVVVGDCTEAHLKTVLNDALAELPVGTPAPPIPVPRGVSNGPRLVFVDNPDATQSTLRVTMPGWSAHHPQRLAGELAVMALGGTFTSRLNQCMREEKGYTYGASATSSSGATFGVVATSATVEQEATAEGLTDMATILQGAVDFTAEELSKVLSASRTSQIATMEGRARTAGMLVRTSRQQLPPDAAVKRLQQEQNITVENINTAWRPLADLSQALVVIVGDSSAVKADVEQALPGTWELLSGPKKWLLSEQE